MTDSTPWTSRTRARVRPPSPAPTIVIIWVSFGRSWPPRYTNTFLTNVFVTPQKNGGQSRLSPATYLLPDGRRGRQTTRAVDGGSCRTRSPRVYGLSS